MARPCKRRVAIVNLAGAVAPGTEVPIPTAAAEFFVRVVNAAGAGVAFTIARRDNPGPVLHITAGEAFVEERLALSEPLVLAIVSAAGSTIEVELWEG